MNKNNSTALVEVSRGGAARIWVLTWILTQLLPIVSTLYELWTFCSQDTGIYSVICPEHTH